MAIQENPYLPPASRVEDAEIVRGDFIDAGRAVPAGHGWDWVAAGWRTFRQQPGTWVLIALVLGILFIAVSLVPLLGTFAPSILMPIFVAGLMLACARVERGEDIGVADLFAGFQKNGGPLALLGLIGLGLFVAAAIPAVVVVLRGVGGGFLSSTGILLFALIYLALLIPVYMALWFGPALVSLQEMAPTRGLAQSFRGCLKNIIPFLVYGVILFLLAIVATIPLMLGWLVLLPVVVTSTYAAYRDIFFES